MTAPVVVVLILTTITVVAVVKVIFDPHFHSRRTVTEHATSAGFRDRAFFGRSLAYVIHFQKPNVG